MTASCGTSTLSANILPSVAACDELGVFSLLDQQPCTRADVAARLNLADDWAEVLLGVLGALDLVRVQDGRFHLTDSARTYLLPESPYYRGFTLRRFAQNDVGQRLKHSLASSSSTSDRYVVREWSAGEITREQAETSTRTMHGLSFPSAVAMARTGEFKDVSRLLDVAGGSGGFAIALAQRYPQMRCTVADLPIVCELAAELIAHYGVQDQVDTLPLNMFFEAWPTGYDAMFFSCVLHDWNLEQRTQLVQNAFAALPSGGRIFIHEMLLNDVGRRTAGTSAVQREHAHRHGRKAVLGAGIAPRPRTGGLPRRFGAEHVCLLLAGLGSAAVELAVEPGVGQLEHLATNKRDRLDSAARQHHLQAAGPRGPTS